MQPHAPNFVTFSSRWDGKETQGGVDEMGRECSDPEEQTTTANQKTTTVQDYELCCIIT